MTKRKALSFILFMTACLASQASSAGEVPDQAALAAFFGVSTGQIHVECPQESFELLEVKGERGDKSSSTTSTSQKELKICLDYADRQKRCEISVAALDAFPARYHFSMAIQEYPDSPSDRWHSVFQLHSFPDTGEAWRCPPISFEAEHGKFRAFNRWDDQKISRTLGYNCTEEGSSLQTRQILRNVDVGYGEWKLFQIDMMASPDTDGLLSIRSGQGKIRQFSGGNVYNDERPPYLKFGVYKPAGWSEIEKKSGQPICVGYKDVVIQSKKLSQ